MSAFVKKLFKHGGSYATDIPMEFVRNNPSKEVIIESSDDELVIRAKTSLDTIESEPMFAHFVNSLTADAMKHPEKLKSVKEVWDEEWDKLLKDVSDDE